MKVICISDTHGEHRKASIPDGDLLIHAGDISNGHPREVEDFLAWFDRLPHPHKVFIGGNMDYPLARASSPYLADLPSNIHYLQDSGKEIEGLSIWGSPWIPSFVGVFMKERGKEINACWEKIPEKLDILITHTPPYGILDITSRGMHVGCADLARNIGQLSPKFHIFGHVHEAYGRKEEAATQFYNVAFLNRKGYNPAIEISL